MADHNSPLCLAFSIALSAYLNPLFVVMSCSGVHRTTVQSFGAALPIEELGSQQYSIMYLCLLFLVPDFESPVCPSLPMSPDPSLVDGRPRFLFGTPPSFGGFENRAAASGSLARMRSWNRPRHATEWVGSTFMHPRQLGVSPYRSMRAFVMYGLNCKFGLISFSCAFSSVSSPLTGVRGLVDVSSEADCRGACCTSW